MLCKVVWRITLIISCLTLSGFNSVWASLSDPTDDSSATTTTQTTSTDQNQQKNNQERTKLTQKVIKALTKTDYKKWSSQQNFNGEVDQEEGKLFASDDYDSVGDNE
ncbi:hypothetical protein Psal071_03154 [Piscirickettsia salmonis]|uniref:Uncharacterized protein n=1 Tax=Piscirickettsia salmonis TaxID=1238 RepID=A0A9Q6PTM9_PISSA|nr:hypothetical protein [Piscirickettsia salmonis]ALA23599.1 hypothetical protein KW89_128 [Piscirickettsia salmonis]QGN78880.1 hypothetical protein Psal001_03135 [Piscirickettsia salmonis]QGN82465.1 hypothetical protein Psal002_03155 [Piscirickettsia salmonis]QGN86041.1 hypothetical protein Psal003_03141 [Piscirickettsia salmonis]QGN89547.1 hypothetical protein Psal004_03133 [Piscirickettsia salmonis]